MSDAELKRQARRILGEKCANPGCRWLNEDAPWGAPTKERSLITLRVAGARLVGKEGIPFV
jgi:hypothetical protein